MRGEFHRADGLILPNNVTLLGEQLILQMAFQNIDSTLAFGLVSAAYTPGMTLADVIEPTIGSHGYARQAVTRDAGHWTLGALNNETYIESPSLVWTPTDTGFDHPITRLVLMDATVGGNILALSASLQAAISLLPTTPVQQRTFKYRLFLR